MTAVRKEAAVDRWMRSCRRVASNKQPKRAQLTVIAALPALKIFRLREGEPHLGVYLQWPDGQKTAGEELRERKGSGGLSEKSQGREQTREKPTWRDVQSAANHDELP